MFAYLDESGDLGFNLARPTTSRCFLVTALVCTNANPVDKAVKKVFAGFSKTELKNHHGSLHAFSERPVTREKLLRRLAELDIRVMAVMLDKTKVFSDVANGPHHLYALLVNALMNRVISDDFYDGSPLHLVASQRETASLLNSRFVTQVVEHGRTQLGLTMTVEIRHAASVRGLQAVDVASWSLFRQYEHDDPTYASLLGGRLAGVHRVLG